MRLLKLLIAVSLCLILSVSVFAHPGGTDSSGGHYNRSTGEYHYHHGYSAHQHYDKDGDGIPDCPYNFKDKTGSSSGSSSSSNSSTKTESSTREPSKPTAKNESSKKTSKEETVENYILIITGISLFVSFVVDALEVITNKSKRKSKE